MLKDYATSEITYFLGFHTSIPKKNRYLGPYSRRSVGLSITNMSSESTGRIELLAYN